MTDSNIEKTIEKLGVTASSLQKVTLGPGLVGKIGGLAIAGTVALTALGVASGNPWVMAGVAGLAFTLVVVVTYKLVDLAKTRPDVALLEGAEFLVYHNKLEIGTKEHGKITRSGPIVSDPDQIALPSHGEVAVVPEQVESIAGATEEKE